MTQDKRIINIDESVIRYTDHRKRGWYMKHRHNMVTRNRRLNGVNIIAAISNKGEFYYTVNQGKTNCLTFTLYLSKLVDHLELVDRKWRDNTIIMIDNAQYHRGALT